MQGASVKKGNDTSCRAVWQRASISVRAAISVRRDDMCDSVVIDGVGSGTYIALRDRRARAQHAGMRTVSGVTAE